MKRPNTAVLAAIVFPLVFVLPPGARDRHAQIKAAPIAATMVERGKFLFFDFKHIIGEESYEIAQDGDNLVIRSQLELASEQKASLTATLTVLPTFTPLKFEVKGRKPSGSEVDSSVEITGSDATVREGSSTTKVRVPNRFFTLAGYAPLALEMMLIRYWSKNRDKGPLKILPKGEVNVEHRGRDAVSIEGKQTQLERYSLAGLTWGRQTIWLDPAGKVIAVIGIGGDTESTMPAIREGFESNIPFFLKRAAEDAAARFTETSTRMRPRPRGPVAITCATLIDGTGSAPVADSVILIAGDRIISAGRRSQITIPKGSTVIDARGKYILPGLWDMHAHLFQPEFGPAYLAAGVTTVRDVGNEFEFVTSLREAFRGGGLGPWMLLAGYIDGKPKQQSFDVQVDTPDEARAAVQRYSNARFEQIKVRDNLKLDILKVIGEEAHRLGMTLTGHVPGGINAVQAVEAGQDQISHINFVAPIFDFKRNPAGQGFVVDLDAPRTKHALEVFKQHHTAVDPTLAYMEMLLRSKDTAITTFEPGFGKLPVSYAEHFGSDSSDAGGFRPPNALAGFFAVIVALHKAGVPVMVGTDVVVPGHSVHRELELFVKAGFTPMEAIQAATIVPARVMKLEQEVGTIEKGKRADLIIVAASPLESISNIRKVESIIVRGRFFDCALLWQIAGFQP